MANLSLDSLEVDCVLAEQYLKKYNNFEEWPTSGQYWLVKDYPNRKECNFERDIVTMQDVQLAGANMGEGVKLAKKIEENVILFSQLEYQIRKTDAIDVQNNIKLLSQHLQCYNEFSPSLPAMGILMNEKTPLYTLGCVASVLNRQKTSDTSKSIVYIVTTQKMAPLCQLFTELCTQVGCKIPVYYVSDTEEFKTTATDRDLLIDGTDEAGGGCTGVVTETADIDSAMDAFVDSSPSAPWKLRRIYVQESVYGEAKSILVSKCSRVKVNSCADAFTVGGKLFVCDALSDRVTSPVDGRVVHIEAYRTPKEVRGFLSDKTSPFVSIWAADAAYSQELAFSVPAARIWINEYASFDGPPSSSLPVYDQIYPRYNRPYCHNVKILSNLSGAWTKLTENKRVELMLNALQDHLSSTRSDSERVDRLQDIILSRRGEGFVSVSDGRMCFGVEQLRGVAVVDVVSDNLLSDAVHSIIRGDAVSYILNDAFEEFRGSFESLMMAGVPICSAMSPEASAQKARTPVLYKKTKVISTNFGTIFAN